MLAWVSAADEVFSFFIVLTNSKHLREKQMYIAIVSHSEIPYHEVGFVPVGVICVPSCGLVYNLCLACIEMMAQQNTFQSHNLQSWSQEI